MFLDERFDLRQRDRFDALNRPRGGMRQGRPFKKHRFELAVGNVIVIALLAAQRTDHGRFHFLQRNVSEVGRFNQFVEQIDRVVELLFERPDFEHHRLRASMDAQMDRAGLQRLGKAHGTALCRSFIEHGRRDSRQSRMLSVFDGTAFLEHQLH